MKREELIEKGYSKEQVDDILNMFHGMGDEIKNLKADLQSKNELETKFNNSQSKLNEIQTQLDAINQEKMTEQEKLEAREKAIAEKEASANRIYNTARAKEILSQTGLQGEDLEKLVASVVTNEETTTVNNATTFLNSFNSMKESTIKATKEELININAKPAISNADNDDVMTFDKFRTLTSEEQSKFAEEHPEEFARL